MNVGEYGIHFVFSTGFDMRANTAISITFTKPDGSELVVQNPSDGNLTVGTMDINTVYGLFPANLYLDYVFQNGDVDQAGTWGARCTYTDASQHLISDPTTFTVNE